MHRTQDTSPARYEARGQAHVVKFLSAGFCELTDTRLGKEESAAADHMILIGRTR
jgi:hypothetical protein